MTDEQFEKLEQVIREANNHPAQKMCCFVCDHCEIRKYTLRAHCNLHGYDLYDANDSVCFQYRPLRKEE